MGLFALIGTITAGFFTDHLGVVTVLNIQAAGSRAAATRERPSAIANRTRAC